MTVNPDEKKDLKDLNGYSNGGFKQEDDDKDNSSTALETRENSQNVQEYPFKFSWRLLWAFTGPGWLMSIAYLDPGNIEADLQSGVVAGYKLIWVLLVATIAGHIMQRLSARLGIVSGKHLAEVCEENYPKGPNFLLWVMVEIAVIGSDMQEVIGTSLALYLLTDGYLAVQWGCLITILDTFTFLFLDHYGRRKLELFFAFLIIVMAVAFGINYGVDLPPQGEVALGVVWPRIPNNDALLQAVATAGAVIMPHNLYLHSGLVSSRKINRKCKSEVRDANFYTALEGAIALFISFIISLVVVSVFGYGMHGTTNQQVYDTCASRGVKDWWREEFNCNGTANSTQTSTCDPNEQVEGDIFRAGIFLGCTFGAAFCYIWSVGILASGQASTMTGTYAGQFCMQGFLGLKWAQWKILIVTRLFAMLPTLLVAFFYDVKTITTLNDYLNAVMFIMLPFAVIPTITFTSNRLVMGDFKNGLYSKIVTSSLSLIIIGINFYFAYESFNNWINDYAEESTHVLWWLLVGVFAIVYLVFLVYLGFYMIICLGQESLTQYAFIRRIYRVENFVTKNPEVDALKA